MIHKNIPKEGIKYKKKRLLNKQKSSVKTCLKKVRSITRNKKNAKSKTGDYDRKAKLKLKTLKESKKLPTKTSPKNNKIKTKRYKRGGDLQNEQNQELQYIIKKLQTEYQLAKQKRERLMYTFENFFPFKNFETLPSKDQQKKELEKYVKWFKNVINAIDEEFNIKKKMIPFFKLYPDIQKNQFFKYLMKMKESTKEYKKMSDKSDDLIKKSYRESNYTRSFFSTILNVLPKMLNIDYEHEKIVFIVYYYSIKLKSQFSRDEERKILAEINKMEMILYERPEIMTEFGSLHR